MPKPNQQNNKSSEAGFYQNLKKEVRSHLIKYIAATIVLVIGGAVATIWDRLDLTPYNKGGFQVSIKDQTTAEDYEFRIYQENYFIQNVNIDKTYNFPPGNYELKIKLNWSAEPILLEKFKVIKGKNTNILSEIPKPGIASILGEVKLRGKSLDPGVNLTVEAYEQNKFTSTNDDGHYFLEVQPDLCVRLYVKNNSKIIWTTAVFDVKSNGLRRKNITIPYEKIR